MATSSATEYLILTIDPYNGPYFSGSHTTEGAAISVAEAYAEGDPSSGFMVLPGTVYRKVVE